MSVSASRTTLLLWAVATALPAHAADVTFHFRPAADARTVTVAGTFNGWNSAADPMADADGDGVWSTTLPLEPGRQSYKFVVNGTDWFEDPTAAEFEDDGFGGRNSVLNVGSAPLVVGIDDTEPEVDTRPEVTFRFRCGERHVRAVSVAGSFNGWDAGAHPLVDADHDGTWSATFRIDPGRHAFQFVIDGREWRSCDTSVSHEPDGFGGRRAILEVGESTVVEGSLD